MLRQRCLYVVLIALMISLPAPEIGATKASVGCELQGSNPVDEYSVATYTLNGSTCAAAATWTTTCGSIIAGSQTSNSVQIYFNTFGCSSTVVTALNSSGGTIASITVSINPALPLGGGTISNSLQVSNYAAAPAQLIASLPSNGYCENYAYVWYSSPDNSNFTAIAGATDQNYQPGVLYDTTYFRRAVVCGPQTANSNVATVIVYPPLVSGIPNPSTQTINYNTSPAAISFSSSSGGNGTYAYQWQSSPTSTGTFVAISGATGTNYTPGVLTQSTYFNVVTNSNGAMVTSVPVMVGVLDFNYVRTREVTISGQADKASADLITDPASVRQTTQYMDGIGRPVQVVTKQGSPLQKDIVNLHVYDNYGRESFHYMPYTAPSSDGLPKINAITEQNAFNAAQFPNDQNYYAQTLFEASPLNRTKEQGAPGSPWQPNTSGTGHTIRKNYYSNGATEVFLFGYDPVNNIVTLNTDPALKYYASNQLHVTSTNDENNNQMIEYVDKLGHTVCKKVQYGLNGTTVLFASTYYIYDDMENLVVVLPPEAVNTMTSTQ